MTRVSLAILVILISIPLAGNAAFIERDWLAAGDKHLTYVTDLNIEILDVTFTSELHHTISDELKNGTFFSGFRFMTSFEMYQIMDGFLGGELDTRNAHADLSGSESAAVVNFLSLIGASYLNANTCEHALGCEYYSSGHALFQGRRHLLGHNMIFHDDDNTATGTQLLVRDVPLPSSLALMFLGLFGVALTHWKRKRMSFQG